METQPDLFTIRKSESVEGTTSCSDGRIVYAVNSITSFASNQVRNLSKICLPVFVQEHLQCSCLRTCIYTTSGCTR